MEQVIVRERADPGIVPPRLPLESATNDAPKLGLNDLKPLFDFESVTISTKITSQWHLSQLIARLEKLMPMLPEGAKEQDGEPN
jgi:hypothetical protein